MTQLSLRETFPLLARHEGIWEGWYRHIGVDGELIDSHRSRLICRIPDDRPNVYHQTNHYSWENGESEQREFIGEADGNKMVFDNDLIHGWAAEEPLDHSRRTMLLHWTRVGEEGLYLYEMIQLSDCGKHRARVWQWLKDGQTIKRTLVDEHKVSDDWRGA